jgi:hypothetical protein
VKWMRQDARRMGGVTCRGHVHRLAIGVVVLRDVICDASFSHGMLDEFINVVWDRLICPHGRIESPSETMNRLVSKKGTCPRGSHCEVADVTVFDCRFREGPRKI